MDKKNDKFGKRKADSLEEIREHWKVPQRDLVEPIKKPPIPHNINFEKLKNIVEQYADKLNDAKGIMELLPDTLLVKDILVASILSPKDLTDINLQINISKDAPPEIAELISTHFSTVYDLDSKLSSILGEALFELGCYILMPLPPTAIRSMIQANTVGLEEDQRNQVLHNFITTGDLPNIGILHDSAMGNIYAMETFKEDDLTKCGLESSSKLVEITDNAMYLVYPALRESVEHSKIKSTLKNAYGLEGIIEDNGNGGVYLKTTTAFVPTVLLSPGDSETEAFNPVVLNLPAESVIPVHIPGEPENHVGYFIVVDTDGNPINIPSNSNRFKQLNERLKEAIETNATVINNTNIVQTSVTQKTDATKPMLDAYIDQFERELKQAVARGTAGKTVEISAPGELYRIMFARQLQKQKTRVVYVPAAMISYIAFNYNDLGIGESLLEKTKLYASLRAILLFATMMSGVKNSVSGRVLTITLDADDSDPQGTVEAILNEFVSLQTTSLPIGYLNPSDIINSLQRSGIQIKVNGGSLFPGTEIDVVENKREIAIPDTDLSMMLKVAHYAGLWVSPDLVDKSLEGDFATGIVASNLLQAKRVKVCQKQYTEHLSKFIHKYIYAGGPLYIRIKELYAKHKGSKMTLEQVIESIEVTLPKPDTAVLRSQYGEWQDYGTFVSEALDVYLTDGSLAAFELDDTTESIDAIKAEVIGYIKRQYLRNQNLLPEFDAGIISPDSTMSKNITQHNDMVQKVLKEVVEAVKKARAKALEGSTPPADEFNTPDDGTTPPNSEDGTDASAADDTEVSEDTGSVAPKEASSPDNTEVPTIPEIPVTPTPNIKPTNKP